MCFKDRFSVIDNHKIFFYNLLHVLWGICEALPSLLLLQLVMLLELLSVYSVHLLFPCKSSCSLFQIYVVSSFNHIIFMRNLSYLLLTFERV